MVLAPTKTVRRVAYEFRQLCHEPVLLATILTIGALLAVFVIWPLVKVFAASFQVDGRWTFGVYQKILGEPFSRKPLLNSLELGLIVAVLSTLIGFLFAFAVTRTDMPFRRFFRLAATFPIISPPFVISIAAILLFGKNGFVTQRIFQGLVDFKIYGLNGLVLVETMAYFPMAFLTLVGVLDAIDPTLEDSALDLGASRFRVFRTITLPLATPGVLSALLLVFIESLADFGNPMLLSGDFQVLSVQAYLRITGLYDLPAGAALAIFLLVPSLAAFALQKYLLSRKSYVTVTGKPGGARALKQSPGVTWLLFGLCVLVCGGLLLFYGMVLVGSFVKLWGVNYGFTLANYRHVFVVGASHIRDTLYLATIATPATGLLGMVIAFLVVRKRFAGRGLLEAVSLLTFAVPGTVVGIGYILAFNERPLLLTGTAAIIVLLFIFRNVPVGIQNGVAALKQIDPAIEEASIDLGATSLGTFRRITLPLITPAFFSGLVFSFVRCMTAISAVIFVVSGRWHLITVAILDCVGNSDLAQAAAFCMVVIAAILIALGILQALVGRVGKGVHSISA